MTVQILVFFQMSPIVLWAFITFDYLLTLE